MSTSGAVVFKILSIDGGGIRGLYSAQFLSVLEQCFRCRIVDYFDMICGTSTGGLIALGLALGIPAIDISRFYVEHGARIFPPKHRWFRTIGQIFGKGKYSNKDLKTALASVLGNRRIADVECLICIPSHSLTHARPYIFKYDHPEGRLGRDNETSVVDVALATSAAPTYFPIVEISNHHDQFVDGGVAANNPALVGLLEAIRHFVGTGKAYNRARMLSIETIGPKAGRLLHSRKATGVLFWREDLVNLFAEGQARMTSFAMEQLCSSGFIPCDYVRLSSPDVSPLQSTELSLDNASPNALRLLKAAGDDRANHYVIKDEVASFFADKKTYVIRKGMQHG